MDELRLILAELLIKHEKYEEKINNSQKTRKYLEKYEQLVINIEIVVAAMRNLYRSGSFEPTAVLMRKNC
jgi:hypothetical protein